jgi:hypothetical protein
MLEAGDFVGIRPLVGARGYESARVARVTWQLPPSDDVQRKIDPVYFFVRLYFK